MSSGFTDHVIRVTVLSNSVPVNPGELTEFQRQSIESVIRSAIRDTYSFISELRTLQVNVLQESNYYTVQVRFRPMSSSIGIPQIQSRGADISGQQFTVTFTRISPSPTSALDSALRGLPTYTFTSGMPPGLADRLARLRSGENLREPISQEEITRGLSSVLPPSTPSSFTMPPPSRAAYGPDGRLGSTLDFRPFSRGVAPPPSILRSSPRMTSLRSDAEGKTEDDSGYEEIDYSGKVFDIVAYDNIPIRTYLNEDSDNVIIIVETAGSQRRAYGYTRSGLRAQYTDMSAIRYRCNDTLPPIPLEIRPTDVEFRNPYYRLATAIGNFLIPIPQARRMFDSTHRFWIMRRPEGNPSVTRVAAHSVLFSGRTNRRAEQLNLEGEVVNLSSAEHCAAGASTPVMTLTPVRLTTVPSSEPDSESKQMEEGGRRRRRPATRRQKKRRGHPTRRRKVRPTRK